MRMLRRARSGEGFTLVEVLIVVAIISILASIAIPATARARMAATEAQMLGLVRAINGAQASYAASCAFGFYAPSLFTLTRPPAMGGDGWIDPSLNRNFFFQGNYFVWFLRGQRGGNTPTCNGMPAGSTVSSYWFGVWPFANRSVRSFGSNQGATIYESREFIRPTWNGAPPSPARPLQ
ncbi:MAG: prepilin-type N-terminal cleavage/methylation domain-containing protein [Vicinamibacterales bacterium]|nr:prepilin-type N-terminal cleavage/methylation domain-containing protein [Vicinamibacterales bacterium]